MEKFLLSLFAGILLTGCVSNNMSVTSDEAFLTMMIPHHQEAVETSKIILQKSQNPELKKLAAAIVEAQEAEITLMKEWQKDWFGNEEIGNYMNMMGDLTKLEGDELDQAFIKSMIHHHEGAIMMAEQIKQTTERPEIKKMAEDIIKTQTEEIALLKSWVK